MSPKNAMATIECPEGNEKPVSSMRRKPSGRGRWTRVFSPTFKSATSTRLTAQHHPGRAPGAKAAITRSSTTSTTGLASAENPSITGVSHGVRRRSTMSA